MRVLFVHPNRDQYGEDTVLLGAIQTLDQDHIVTQVALCPSQTPSARMLRELARAGVPVSDLQDVPHEIRTQPDTTWNVTVSVSTTFPQGAEIARRTRTPHLWLACDALEHGVPLAIRLQLLRDPTLVLVADEATLQRVRLPRACTTKLLPYSVDARQWTRDRNGMRLRDTIGCPIDAPVIGAFAPATMDTHDYQFLDALIAAVREHQTLRCVLADMPTSIAQWIEQAAEDLSVRSRIHMVSAPTDPAEFLAALDIFACGPGPSATRSIRALEAMFGAKPIVAFGSDGLLDLIRQGETGWIIRERDRHVFAEIVAALASDSTRREAMGLAGRNHALARHDLQTMAVTWNGILTSLTQ